MHDMLHFGHHGVAQRGDVDPRQRGGRRQCGFGATLAVQTERGRRYDLLLTVGAHVGEMLRSG